MAIIAQAEYYVTPIVCGCLGHSVISLSKTNDAIYMKFADVLEIDKSNIWLNFDSDLINGSWARSNFSVPKKTS